MAIYSNSQLSAFAGLPHHLDNEISGLFQDFSGNIPFFSRLLKINFQDFSRCLTDEPTMRDANFALVMVGGADFGPSDARKKHLFCWYSAVSCPIFKVFAPKSLAVR